MVVSEGREMSYYGIGVNGALNRLLKIATFRRIGPEKYEGWQQGDIFTAICPQDNESTKMIMIEVAKKPLINMGVRNLLDGYPTPLHALFDLRKYNGYEDINLLTKLWSFSAIPLWRERNLAWSTQHVLENQTLWEAIRYEPKLFKPAILNALRNLLPR